MAIALDTVGTFSNSGTTLTPSNTFNNAAGNFMVVGFFYSKDATLSTITYNSVAMTVADTITMTGWVYKVSFCYLSSPSTGSNTVNATLTGTSNQATILQAISYSGAATSSPVDSTATTVYTTSGTTQQITLNPTTSTGWLVGWFTNSNSGTISGGTNTTLRGVTQPQWGFADTNGTIGSGAQTLNLTTSASFSAEGGVFQGISFKAPAVAGGSDPMFMGAAF